jgi:hypothetical protein
MGGSGAIVHGAWWRIIVAFKHSMSEDRFTR